MRPVPCFHRFHPSTAVAAAQVVPPTPLSPRPPPILATCSTHQEADTGWDADSEASDPRAHAAAGIGAHGGVDDRGRAGSPPPKPLPQAPARTPIYERAATPGLSSVPPHAPAAEAIEGVDQPPPLLTEHPSFTRPVLGTAPEPIPRTATGTVPISGRGFPKAPFPAAAEASGVEAAAAVGSRPHVSVRVNAPAEELGRGKDGGEEMGGVIAGAAAGGGGHPVG